MQRPLWYVHNQKFGVGKNFLETVLIYWFGDQETFLTIINVENFAT